MDKEARAKLEVFRQIQKEWTEVHKAIGHDLPFAPRVGSEARVIYDEENRN